MAVTKEECSDTPTTNNFPFFLDDYDSGGGNESTASSDYFSFGEEVDCSTDQDGPDGTPFEQNGSPSVGILHILSQPLQQPPPQQHQ